jgi:acetyltransferase-like isoleucine patch superfamily enzyme
MAEIDPSARVHPTAELEEGVEIGARTAVWSGVHVRGPGTRLGSDCIIGERTYIAYGVQIGSLVKINAGAYVCTGVTVHDGVLVGAGVVFTNDRYPRATTPDLRTLRASEPDERTLPTLVEEGASIGAGSVIGCDLVVGRFALVGMGSVVTRSVPAFTLVVGQPARAIGIVSRAGAPLLRFSGALPPDREDLVCPSTGLRYAVRDGRVVELDPPESP